eukprot:scaffold240598_cov29-Prasinocladus_malaysianus.AAC.1
MKSVETLLLNIQQQLQAHIDRGNAINSIVVLHDLQPAPALRQQFSSKYDCPHPASKEYTALLAHDLSLRSRRLQLGLCW